MGAVANNPEFAEEVGVSQSVGAEFMAKDKKGRVRKYQRGDVVRGLGQQPLPMAEQGLGSMLRPRTPMGGPPRTPPMGFTPRGSLPTIGASEGRFRRPGTPMDEVRDRPFGLTVEDVTQSKKERERKKRKKKKSTGGTVKSYHYGGKIRARGKETRGRRKAKMIRMKGS